MRQFIRLIVTGLFGLFLIVGGTLFRQAIEEFAASQGWNKVFVVGWQAVTNLGLESFVAFGFFFFGGATIALWVDYWFRSREGGYAPSAKADFYWEESWDVQQGEDFENIHRWYVWTQGPKVTITLIFDKPVAKAHIMTLSTTENVTWTELASSDRFLILEVTGRRNGSRFTVHAIGEKFAGDDRRQLVGVPQDASFVKKICK